MKSKFVTALLFGVVALITIGLTSCINVDVQNIPDKFDFKSQVNFVNLAYLSGRATVTIDNQTIGSIDVGAETGYVEIPAGGRTVKVTYANNTSTEEKRSFSSDRVYRVFIVEDTAGNKNIVYFNDRYTFEDKTKPDTALVRLFHGSALTPPITAVNIKLGTVVDTTVALSTPLPFGYGTPYLELPAAGPYTFTLYSDTVAVVTASNITLGSKKAYTGVIYTQGGQLKWKLFTD